MTDKFIRKEKIMKKIIKIMTVALLCVVIVLPSRINASAASGRISVRGSGVYEADADFGEICFTAEGKGTSVEEAAEKMEKSASTLVKTASEYGSVTTESFFTYTDCSGEVVAQRCYLVSSTSVKKLPELQGKLIKGGATTVGSPFYILRDRSEATLKALNAAISDAKTRAKELGAEGEPTFICDLGCDHCQYRPYCSANSDGKVLIECRVILTYGAPTDK